MNPGSMPLSNYVGQPQAGAVTGIEVGVCIQVMAFDASTLQRTFSVVTYPAPCTRQLVDGERPAPGTAVPLALGPRWLAYASNQVSPPTEEPLSLI